MSENIGKELILAIYSRLKDRDVDLQELGWNELSIIPIVDNALIRQRNQSRQRAFREVLGWMEELKEEYGYFDYQTYSRLWRRFEDKLKQAAGEGEK